MHSFKQSTLVEVRRAPRRGRGGRGVFAATFIAKGSLIERVPVLVVPSEQVYGSEGTPPARLKWYVYDWSEVTGKDELAVALGYGSLYNHAATANAVFYTRAPDVLEFFAHRDIAPGEEVVINYHGGPDDPTPVDFETHPPARVEL